jgi:hypothetical protein
MRYLLNRDDRQGAAANSRPMARQASPHSDFDTPRSCRSQSAASMMSGHLHSYIRRAASLALFK